MRRFSLVAIIVVSVLFVPARPAEAQLWRWLEELSGPTLHGPALEFSGLCRGLEGRNQNTQDYTQGEGAPQTKWSVSPYCSGLDPKQQWIELGVQVYMVAGDNTMTEESGDRVDAIGFLPTVTFMFDRRIGVGGGVGVRRYSTPYGHFSKADLEAWLRLRPLSVIDGLVNPGGSGEGGDWLEVRAGWVFHSSFPEGRFGRGTAALDAGPSFFLMAGINLIR